MAGRGRPKGSGVVSKKSLENLDYKRVPRYEARKLPRNISVTDLAWGNLKDMASSRGISLSDLLEYIGRGMIELRDIDQDNKAA